MSERDVTLAGVTFDMTINGQLFEGLGASSAMEILDSARKHHSLDIQAVHMGPYGLVVFSGPLVVAARVANTNGHDIEALRLLIKDTLDQMLLLL